MAENNFIRLASIDVSKHIEKKNNLSYLSWAWAVDQLLRADPTANWVFNEPTEFNGTLMVFCTVTAFGKSMMMQLPVMDYRNKSIPKPDAFAVNTAMMRCLVKAIALHGLGLYIYAGEDVPQEVSGKPTKNELFKPDEEEITYLLSIVDAVKANGTDYETSAIYLAECDLDADEKTWVWDKLDAPTRSGIKDANRYKKLISSEKEKDAQPSATTA